MSNLGGEWHSYFEGLKIRWKFFYTSEDIKTFARLSGDYNPIHLDPEFANKKGFDAPLIYGVLLCAQASRLIGEELPDRHSILTNINMEFISPGFAEDDLEFEAILVRKSDSTSSLEFKCRIFFALDGKTLCRGTVGAIWRH